MDEDERQIRLTTALLDTRGILARYRDRARRGCVWPRLDDGFVREFLSRWDGGVITARAVCEAKAGSLRIQPRWKEVSAEFQEKWEVAARLLEEALESERATEVAA